MGEISEMGMRPTASLGEVGGTIYKAERSEKHRVGARMGPGERPSALIESRRRPSAADADDDAEDEVGDDDRRDDDDDERRATTMTTLWASAKVERW